MKNRIDIYVSSSSTSRDLQQYNLQVVNAILRLGYYPILSEAFNSLQYAYDKMQEAEIFIGIYTSNYGFVPSEPSSFRTLDGELVITDAETSIIEWEYRWALEKNIPMLMFMLNDKAPENLFLWSISMTDNKWTDNKRRQEKLKIFKEKILNNHVVGFFDSPNDLAINVAIGLTSIAATSFATPPQTELNDGQIDCIKNFDDRVLNSVLKALEINDAFKQKSKLTITDDDPHQLRVKPAFSTPPSQLLQYQCDVFVIMPFADRFTAVYSDIITPICSELQLSVKRGDNFFANHYIVEEIWFALNNSRLVIADCTGRNANVFYELGIAHTLGKSTILITQSVNDIPFDVAGRRFIQYEDTLAGSRRLTEQLKEKILIVLNQQENNEIE